MFGTYSSLIHAHSDGVSCSSLWKHGTLSLINMLWGIDLLNLWYVESYYLILYKKFHNPRTYPSVWKPRTKM